MKLLMVGIDYEKAPLDIRAAFSFQKKETVTALEGLMDKEQIAGTLLLSTCNRTELYLSAEEDFCQPESLFCELAGLEEEKYRAYMICREGEMLVDHLFQLSCGMKSRVFGEDQIISQIREALELAREAKATDYFLEKLFLAAITVGKRVRSSVRLTSVKSSVVSSMIELLEKEDEDVSSFRCMVIGNGEIGRLAAKSLKEKGAEVLVTVRNYKTRQVEIPEGCRIIGYKERYEQMADYDLILSATRSPHYTLTYEEGRKLFQDGKRRILVDLAVPRDIEEKLAEIDGICLYDIDQIGNPGKEEDDQALLQAMELIEEQKKLLQQELNVRGYVDKVELISQNGGELTYRRAEKELMAALEKQDEALLHAAVGQAAKKTLSAVIFSLKKVLSQEEWEACVEELEEKLEVF